MTLSHYAFRGVEDMPYILGLVRAQPASCRHVIDLPWRLSSPAINEGRDAERGRPLPYSVEFRDDDHERRSLCMAHGFVLDEHDDYVSLHRPLVALALVPTLPDGFALRSLHGASEAAAYAALHRAAFASDAMTPDWRARTLQTPQYRADLDLVVTAPSGELAGFCVGWYEPSRRMAQIEPIGVQPEYQQHGLARILLLEILHRFKSAGAESALVETDLERTPARHAYEAIGFQQTHTIRRLEKWAPQ